MRSTSRISSSGCEPEASLPEDLGLRAGVDGDPGLRQQTRDLARRVGTEERERRRLGRHHMQLEVDAHRIAALGEHQRQLVERQRPRAAGRDHEGQRVQVTALDVLDDPVQSLLVGQRARERDRAAERHDGPRARSDQEDVVAERLTGHGLDGVRRGIDAAQTTPHVREARVARDAVEWVGRRGARRERRQHAQWAVGVVALGRENGGGHPVAGEPVQGKRGFQGSGSAAGDQHVRGHATKARSGRRARHPQ